MSDWFAKNVEEDIAKAVVRLSIKLPNRTNIDRDFRPDVEINYDQLETQLEEVPSIFSFWSSVLAEQRAVSTAMERKVKLRRAVLTNSLIEDAKANNIKIAQWQVETLMESDKDLGDFETASIIANRNLSKLFAIVDAIRMKSEALRSLAGFKREELKDAR